jgi:hypothetical protein
MSSPADLIWSGKVNVPIIGAQVEINVNGIGRGAVKGYFGQDGYLGVIVELSDPPEWFVKQNAKQNGGNLCYCFGAEIAGVVKET